MRQRAITGGATLVLLTLLLPWGGMARAAQNPSNTTRTLFVDDDWDPVDRELGNQGALPLDTLYCFADPDDPDYVSGAWGDPGTDSRGFVFDDGGNPATAGWFPVDETAPDGVWWHLADAGLNATHGTLAVLDIEQFDGLANDYALWCGRQNVCGWGQTSGYGNDWDQYAIVNLDPGTYHDVDYDFSIVSDFEGGDADYFEFLYWDGAEWIEEFRFANTRDRTIQTFTGTIGELVDRVAFRFVSDLGASDEDGWYNSDLGAVWLDAITLSSGVILLQTDFEDGTVPAQFEFANAPGAGSFAQLRANVYQEDPFRQNTSFCWTFYDPDIADPPEHPVGAIPYGPPYVDVSIRSPILGRMHMVGDAVGAPLALGADTHLFLEYECYFDNPLDPLIFQTWSVAARTLESPCLGPFWGDAVAWYSDAKQWVRRRRDATLPLLYSARGGTVTGIVVKLNVVDLYDVWGPYLGSGDGHSAAPYFDNVRLAVVGEPGIAWDPKKQNDAQDGFDSGRGTVRIDSALDTAALSNFSVQPGDSIVVGLNMDLDGGILVNNANPTGEDRPELFLLWRVIDGPHMGSTDPAMGDPDGSDGIWSPYTGTMIVNGETWNSMIADSAAVEAYVSDQDFAFDFNDSYFLPGDVMEYFFHAQSENGSISSLPAEALATDPLDRKYRRVRCLPTAGASLLLVEDDERTAWPWEEALAYNGYQSYDVYSTKAPSAGQNNGLAGRADFADIALYDAILWDSGDLPNFTVSSVQSYDKTSDADLLTQYLADSGHDTALWIMGNVVANELHPLSSFLPEVLGAELLSNQYYDDLTGIHVPAVFAQHPCFEYCIPNPWFWVYGGAPSVENFSVLQVAPGNALAEATQAWEVLPLPGAVAGILNRDPDGNGSAVNPAGWANPVLFHPFSYDYCRQGYICPEDPLDYVRLMVGQALSCLFGRLPDENPNDVPDLPAATRLETGFPNPFNPSTTLRFSLAADVHARLAIYDSTGRRLRTLVDEMRPAGRYESVWDGCNDDGHQLASGVYYYRLWAGDYAAGGKLVLLK